MADFRASAISGSITQLVDGTSLIVAGNNVSIVSASGQIVISSTGGGGGADPTANYVIVGNATSSLSNERILRSGHGLTLTDFGAGSGISVALDVSGTWDGSISNPILGQSGLTSGNGNNLTVRAQSTTQGSTIGGTLILSGGHATLKGGDVQIYGGSVTENVAGIGGHIDLFTGNTGNASSFKGRVRVHSNTTRLLELYNIDNTTVFEVPSLRSGFHLYTTSSTGFIKFEATGTNGAIHLITSGVLNISSSGMWLSGTNKIEWASNVVSASIIQSGSTTGQGQDFFIKAQKGSAAAGGNLWLAGGLGGVSGTHRNGDVIVDLGPPVSFVGARFKVITGLDDPRPVLMEVYNGADQTTNINFPGRVLTLNAGQAISILAASSIGVQGVGLVQFTSTNSDVYFNSHTVGGSPIFYFRGVSETIIRTEAISHNGACNNTWANSITSLSHSIGDGGIGTGSNFHIVGQGMQGAGSTGGTLFLSGGKGVLSGGNVEIYAGPSTAAGADGNVILAARSGSVVRQYFNGSSWQEASFETRTTSGGGQQIKTIFTFKIPTNSIARCESVFMARATGETSPEAGIFHRVASYQRTTGSIQRIGATFVSGNFDHRSPLASVNDVGDGITGAVVTWSVTGSSTKTEDWVAFRKLFIYTP